MYVLSGKDASPAIVSSDRKGNECLYIIIIIIIIIMTSLGLTSTCDEDNEYTNPTSSLSPQFIHPTLLSSVVVAIATARTVQVISPV